MSLKNVVKDLNKNEKATASRNGTKTHETGEREDAVKARKEPQSKTTHHSNCAYEKMGRCST